MRGDLEGVDLAEPAGERAGQLLAGGAEPPVAQRGQRRGAALAGDQGVQEPPPAGPEQVGDHYRDLQQRVLEDLLHPVLVPHLVLDQPGPGPGQRPAAQGGQEHVAGTGVQVQFPAAGGPLYRDVHADPGSLGVGQHRQVFQIGPQAGQDVLAGGSDVMGAAGQHVRDPQRDTGRGEQGLDVAAEAMRLAGVPPVDLFAFPAGALLRAPVGCDDFAVRDQVGQPLLLGLLQCLAQGWRAGCEQVDHLRQVPVGGGLGDPEPLA